MKEVVIEIHKERLNAGTVSGGNIKEEAEDILEELEATGTSSLPGFTAITRHLRNHYGAGDIKNISGPS